MNTMTGWYIQGRNGAYVYHSLAVNVPSLIVFVSSTCSQLYRLVTIGHIELIYRVIIVLIEELNMLSLLSKRHWKPLVRLMCRWIISHHSQPTLQYGSAHESILGYIVGLGNTLDRRSSRNSVCFKLMMNQSASRCELIWGVISGCTL